MGFISFELLLTAPGSILRRPVPNDSIYQIIMCMPNLKLLSKKV